MLNNLNTTDMFDMCDKATPLPQEIGFGDEYYTLWEWGVYVKNISKDLETAKREYPDAVVTLRKGMSWTPSDYGKPEDLPVNLFNFGKYRGEEITTDIPASYLEWYWQAVEVDDERRQYVESVMEQMGYVFETIDNTPYNPIHRFHTAEALALDAAYKKSVEEIKALGETVIHVTHNPDCDGFIACDSSSDSYRKVGFKFPAVAEYYYDGCPYYMPAVKGKGKRVKGRDLKVTVSWVSEGDDPTDGYFDILSFEVLKNK